MAAVLEQLSGELARTPSDQDVLRRFAEGCLDAGELERLRVGLEPVLAGLSGPLAVRPVAEVLARTLVAAAERKEKKAPRDALELYLRAARILASAANDRVGAARILAMAWRLVPDERVALASQALFQGTQEPPEYTLVALAEVGISGQRSVALRRLAAGALERRRLDEAEALFARLEALHEGDPDVSAGREVIARLRASADDEVARLQEQLTRATLPAERAATWRRIGEVQRGAGRIAAAREAYASALELGDEAALRPLEGLYRDDDELEALCEVLERVAGRGGDVGMALRKKRFLLLEELGRSEDARRILAAPERVRESGPLEDLRRDAEALADSDPERGALRLEEWATASDDAGARLEAREEAAALARRARGADAPSALEERLWRKVRALDPTHKGAADFYREFYERHPDPRRAYTNLAQLHAITADAAERRAIATEMALLAENNLGHLDKAIEAWRLVERDVDGAEGESDAERELTRLAVWAELRRLYATAGRWHAYVDLLDRWVEASPEIADKVELLFDAVEVYQDPERLPMPAMVLQTYQRIVALVPSHPVALDRLAVGLAEREQWSDLLKVLAQKVELTEEPSELVALFHQIADLYLDHVRSDSQAVAVLERLLELDPDDIQVVRHLRELYRRRQDAELHFAALERELELTSEPSERIALLEALAETAQNAFLQPERAAGFHREILELAPGREESLAALQALHAEQEDWPAYARVLEQRVQEAKSKAAKLPLLLELGECVLTRLGDVERAEQIFQTIAESSPTSVPARRFLQRIFVARGKWDELARLFAKPTKTSGAAGARWKDYVALLKDAAKHERDPALARAIHVEIARVMEAELDDRKSAAEHLEAALRDGDDQVALARKLLELLGDESAAQRRLVALHVLGQHAPDASERYQAWMQAGQLHRRAKDPVGACEAWGKALVIGAELGLIEALPQLEEDAGATGRWESAYAAIDEALGRLPAAAGEASAKEVRAALHRSLGNIARTRLLVPEEAVRHFRWVLQLAPGDAYALEELEKLYYSQSDFAGLEEVYRARIEAAPTAAERLAPLKALGRLFDDVMLDAERAAQIYQDVLHLAPDDQGAFDGLVRALESTKAWGELALALEAGLVRVREPARRRKLRLQLVAVAADRLGDPLAAIEHCRDIIESGPSDAEQNAVRVVLERYAGDPVVGREAAPVLEEVYRRQGRLDALAAMLEARIESAGEAELPHLPRLIDELLMLSGGLHGAPDKAFSLLSRRFAVAPEDPEAWEELEQAAALSNAWEELAAMWKAALEREPPIDLALRPALRLRLADVYHRRLIELEEAIVETERALSETEDDAEALAALELLGVLFKKTADLDSFVRVKLDASRRVLSRSLRRQKVVEAAHALAGALGRPEDAVAVLEPLWIEEPGDSEISDLLLQLHERIGDAEKIDQAYTDAIEAARTAERRDALRLRRALLRRDKRGLWEVAISELIGLVESETAGRDARRALLEVSRAQESEGQRDVILEVLIDYHRRAGDTEGLINTLVVQAEFTEPGSARAAVLRIAAIECLPEIDEADKKAEGAHHAFHLYGQAIFEDPEDGEALERMRRIAAKLGLWAELSEVLQAAVDANGVEGGDELPRGVRGLLREDARIAEEELADDPRAIASLTRELALADAAGELDVAPTLAALSRLYERVGDFEARREVLGRMAAGETDPIARAEVLEALAVLELDVGRVDEAIVALESALEELGQAPRETARATRQRLLATLESVLRSAERFPELVDLLAEAAAFEDAESERRELLHRAAECATDELGDKTRAAVLYEQLVSIDATDEAAVGRLVELYQEAGRWDEAIVALERQRALAEGAGSRAEANEIAFRIGQIQAEHGGGIEAALATLAEVLAHDDAHAGALATLARVETRHPSAGPRARALMADAHRRRGDAEELAAVLERIATFDAPPPLLLAELADLWAGPLGNRARAWAHVARGYALDPSGDEGGACRERLMALTREELADGTADHDKATRRLVQVLDEVGRAIAMAEPRLRRKREDLAAVEALGIGPPEIVPLWRGVLQEEEKDGAVLAALEGWARQEGQLALLAEALEHRLATLSAKKKTPVELELAATLARLSGREAEALRVWRSVLQREPSNAAAFDGLSELQARLGRHAERATLLAEQIERETGARKESLRLELARVRWRSLADAPGAVAILEAVLADGAAAPQDAVELLESIWGEGRERQHVYRLLEPVYRAHEDWDKLVALYMSTLEQDDLELQIECLSKLAELENVRLDRPEAAFTTLLALVERLDGASDEAVRHLDELEALARKLDRWGELIERLEAMVGLGHGGGAVMARLARIHEVESNDSERAAHFYRFAFEHDTTDHQSRDALSQLLERTERWDDLARHLLDAASAEPSRERFDLALRGADVLAQKLGDEARALAVLEGVARDAPADDDASVKAHERIAELLERRQDHAALHRHYRRWLEQAPSDAIAIDVQVRLGRSLIRFPQTAREGLTELEEVLRTVPTRRDVVPALWSMIVACERAEQAAARGAAVIGAAGAEVIDPLYAEATAEAARILEGALGDNAPAATLAGIVQAQLRVCPPGSERQAMLVRLARLMGSLDAPEKAFAYLAEALRGDLENATIEAQLEAIAGEHNYWEALVGLYEECAANDEERVQARYVLKVAHILHGQLGQSEEAASWFERHLAMVPGNREAVEPLAAYYREIGDAASEARILESWIDLSASAEELPELRMRLGVLRMDQLGDVQGAIDALEGCLPESAADVEFVRRLERLYIRGEHFAALVELYRAALKHAEGDKSRLEILAKTAQIHETRLDDAASARETARRMLAIEPLNRFALTTLERIERAAGDWEAVDEVLGKKLEATPAEAARVRILIDRAEVAAAHRERPEEAIEHLVAADRMWGPGPGPDELIKGLEALLRSDPTLRRRAARALEKRYRARQSWQDLINVLMIELVATADASERFALATQAVQIAIERLSDRALALRVLLAALRQAPEAADLRALVEREAREANDYASVLKTGEDMLKRGVPEAALVGFALWLGGIEQRHGERARAIKVFERVLDVDPANAPACDALAALYRDSGDWAALKGIYNQRLAVEAPAERPVLALDLALHLAAHEGPDKTIEAIEGLLAAHPDDQRLRATLMARVAEPVAGAAATDVLAAQLRAQSRWGELVKLLELRADKTGDAAERSTLLREAAVTYESLVGDRIAAVKALARAAEAAPDDLAVWRQLRELGQRIGAWDELARVLRVGVARAGVEVASELALWLAEIEHEQLGLEDGRARALSTLRAGLGKAPNHVGLREAVVRLELAGGDPAVAEEEIAILTDLIEDDEAARGWWRALRALAEAQGDETRMVAANEALLARDHNDGEAAQHLADFYRRAHRWEDLVELSFLRAQAAQEAGDLPAAAACWNEVAQIRYGALGDADGAIEAWREAWELDPTLAEATKKLVQEAAERGGWQDVAGLWQRHAEALEGAAAKAAAYVELGRVQEDKLRDVGAAVEAYEAALEADAQAVAALNALVALYGRTRKYAELAATLGRKAGVVKGAERAMVLVQAAAVELDQLRNAARARPLLEEVLAQDADHVEAQLLLARLQVREGRPGEAAATLQGVVSKTEGKRKLRLLMDLARLLANDVGDLARAREVIEEALSFEEAAPGLDALAIEVLTRAEAWERLAALLEQLWKKAPSASERAERALELARLYLDGALADETKFAAWMDAAREADPERVERSDARLMEVDLLLRRGDDAAVEPLLSEVVRRLEEQRAAEEIAERSHQLGLVRERLGDIEGALAAFSRAHEIDGKNVRKLLDYGRALITGGRWTDALAVHQALLMQRHALSDEAEHHVVLERLALASWEAGQAERARTYLNKLLGERADHPGGLELRARFGG